MTVHPGQTATLNFGNHYTGVRAAGTSEEQPAETPPAVDATSFICLPVVTK